MNSASDEDILLSADFVLQIVAIRSEKPVGLRTLGVGDFPRMGVQFFAVMGDVNLVGVVRPARSLWVFC